MGTQLSAGWGAHGRPGNRAGAETSRAGEARGPGLRFWLGASPLDPGQDASSSQLRLLICKRGQGLPPGRSAEDTGHRGHEGGSPVPVKLGHIQQTAFSSSPTPAKPSPSARSLPLLPSGQLQPNCPASQGISVVSSGHPVAACCCPTPGKGQGLAQCHLPWKLSPVPWAVSCSLF